MLLDPVKQKALVDLVGQPVAERLIANIKEFDEQAIIAGMKFKSLAAPSAEEIMAILSNWHVKGTDMPNDVEQTTKAMDEETTATDSMEKNAKAETGMDEETMMVDESEETGMDEEENDDDVSILSESDIMAIADAVASKIVESMKGMNGGGDYVKTEKAASSLVTIAEAQTEALSQMVKTIKEINVRLEAIEAVSGTPYRPSQASNNVITQKEVHPNKAELPAGLDPKYRDAYMALMDMNFIR